MNSNAAEGPFTNETLISEQIFPQRACFDAAHLACAEPGVPLCFTWRKTEYTVTAVLQSWKTYRPCRNGSGERYVDRRFYRVQTACGKTMTLYKKRTAAKKDTWTIYTMKKTNPLKTAVLVSGGGTNLQALIDEQSRMGEACPYSIELVVSSSAKAYALERAENAHIEHTVASPALLLGAEAAKAATRDEKRLAVSDEVLSLCKSRGIEAIVLAGFLTVLSGAIVDEYAGRIINLHPALLPKFGGVGMYGHHVHEAVLASGERESGCTVHLVDGGCDTGKILLQKKVPVLAGDTCETLYARIAPLEHEAMVEGLKLLACELKA